MSSSKLDTSGAFDPVKISSGETQLTLSENAYRIHKNGVEFQTSESISDWTEMTVELYSPALGRKVKGTGVVVGCHGDRHLGYSVSLVFTDLSPQAEASLSAIAAFS